MGRWKYNLGEQVSGGSPRAGFDWHRGKHRRAAEPADEARKMTVTSSDEQSTAGGSAARRAASRAADAGPSPLSAFRNNPSSPLPAFRNPLPSPLLPPRLPAPSAGSPLTANPCAPLTDHALRARHPPAPVAELASNRLRAAITASFAAAPVLSSTNPPPTAAHTVPAVRHFLAATAPSPAPSLPPPPAVRSRAAAATGGTRGVSGVTGTAGGGGAQVRGMSGGSGGSGGIGGMGGSGGSIYVRSTREPSGLASVPLVPLVLGLAGAIPFVALAPPICSLIPLPELLATQPAAAQAAYGAAILAFLGGPHWGLAMARYAATTSEASLGNFSVAAARYTWSVAPSLAAWVALLLPDGPKFALLLSSFLLVLGVDTVFVRMALVPAWYLPLRVLLSSIALLSLAATAFTVVTGTAISQPSPQSTVISQSTPPATHSTAVPSPADQQPVHSSHPSSSQPSSSQPSSTHPSTFESYPSEKQ
ncbi:unnamed protein product [Closterium sp. NIES-64]|nr:unnamed protein product [Closterium sp. NIES-64]